MQVEIKLRAYFNTSNADLILKHEVPNEPVGECSPIFGIPGRRLTEADCTELIANLRTWLFERFKLEASTALANVQAVLKEKQEAGRKDQ